MITVPPRINTNLIGATMAGFGAVAEFAVTAGWSAEQFADVARFAFERERRAYFRAQSFRHFHGEGLRVTAPPEPLLCGREGCGHAHEGRPCIGVGKTGAGGTWARCSCTEFVAPTTRRRKR